MRNIVFARPDGINTDCGMCEPQLNLLAHAQSIELDIGSQCGGHGVCGGDRVLVEDPAQRAQLSPITESERHHLSEKELAGGWRLACQCFPDKPDQLIRVKTRIR